MSIFIDRELSWIEFNKRVLYLASKTSEPLVERLNFLGITSSNLEEFIRIRVSSALNKSLENEDPGLKEKYIELKRSLLEFINFQYKTFAILIKELKKKDISFSKYEDLSEKEKASADYMFEEDIFPLLTVISYDTSKEFPLLKTGQLNIITQLTNMDSDVICFTPIPDSINRVYKIDTGDKTDKHILIEDLIMGCSDRLFVNKEISFQGVIRLLREADIEIDTAGPIVDRIKDVIKKREWSKPIFLEISDDIPRSIEKALKREFDLDRALIYRTDDPLDLSFLSDRFVRRHDLEYTKFIPKYPKDLVGEPDIFSVMDDSDFILHHPFDSFGGFISLLEQASYDKEVLSIKMTLYRVSSCDSPIIDALCTAASAGKQVAVLLELKARFDEERNISLIDKLKLSGCKIIYGVEEWKTHCKFTIIVRRHKKGLKIYSHVSTGNYNEKTAKIYTDLGYFTTSHKLGSDLLNLFNLLSGWSELTPLSKMSVSPFNYREKLYSLIDREADNAKKGLAALIVFKVNSLCDPGIVSKLYDASKAGVAIFILCRGVCSMRKINDNITIKSVVGRFLEHSRIYYFANSGDIRVFISSADLLTRNLDRRIELFTPIVSSKLKTDLEKILQQYMKDNANSFYMNEENKWIPCKERTHNVHEYFIKHR